MSIAYQPQPASRRPPAKTKPKQVCNCGRCQSCEMRRRWREGVFADRQLPPVWNAWTLAEEAILRRDIGRVPPEEIAAACTAESTIPRSADAVVVHAKGMGLSCERVGYTLEALQALFGVNWQAIRRHWINAGLLRTRVPLLKGSPAWVEPAEVERFIREHSHAYDAASMDPRHPLTALARVVNRRDPWLSAKQLSRRVGRTPSRCRNIVREAGIPHERRLGRAGYGELVIRESNVPLVLAALERLAENKRRAARTAWQARMSRLDRYAALAEQHMAERG